ncbi:antitoxin VapB family protein [Halomicrobium katesii]|uniref:antitoxin VapB family protein n=1 Tax=Halomicrobium katesii TaxID=437163 RepID=UPI001FE02328|nr:antitoxin VapB family protein [Halomicrobium katesii]
MRVSECIKKRLDNRRRESESYNDVLDRLIEDTTESDFDDGFGILSEKQGEWIREKRVKAKEDRKERLRDLGNT